MLKAAATDGHRLARVTVPRPEGAQGMPGVIIPRKCVAELRKLLDEVDGTVQASLSRNQDPLRARQCGADLEADRRHVPRLQPRHPDRERQIAQARSARLEEAVDRVSTIASERTRAVKMSLDRDRVTLSVTSPENGTAVEEISADYGADGIEIGFNARYLLDILGQIEGDMMEVHLADAAAPTLLRENDKAPALYVLMPMRV